jgi:hypothetical protein
MIILLRIEESAVVDRICFWVRITHGPILTPTRAMTIAVFSRLRLSSLTERIGLDFVAAGGSVTFGVGGSDHSISLRLLDNAVLDGDRTVRLRVTIPNGASLPAASFTILNDELGFVPGDSFTFPNGRFLMNVTGNFARTNVRIEISSDLVGWGEWGQMPNDSQVINFDGSSDKQLFYRLVSD